MASVTLPPIIERTHTGFVSLRAVAEVPETRYATTTYGLHIAYQGSWHLFAVES